jgi:hypothetical protein
MDTGLRFQATCQFHGMGPFLYRGFTTASTIDSADAWPFSSAAQNRQLKDAMRFESNGSGKCQKLLCTRKAGHV